MDSTAKISLMIRKKNKHLFFFPCLVWIGLMSLRSPAVDFRHIWAERELTEGVLTVDISWMSHDHMMSGPRASGRKKQKRKKNPCRRLCFVTSCTSTLVFVLCCSCGSGPKHCAASWLPIASTCTFKVGKPHGAGWQWCLDVFFSPGDFPAENSSRLWLSGLSVRLCSSLIISVCGTLTITAQPSGASYGTNHWTHCWMQYASKKKIKREKGLHWFV